MLGIFSLNVNGLNSPVKRKRVMSKLKKEKRQIIFLQETHLTNIEHEKLKRFGYRNSYYSSYSGGKRRGVIILIANTVNFELEKETKDKEGRYIIVRGKIQNELVTLVNIYAPPESDKCFFKNMFDNIAVEMKGLLIAGGDTNVVLCDKKDTTSKKRSKPHIARFVKLSLEEMGLEDMWRKLHPTEIDFTHWSAVYKTHSRIDYMFVNKEDSYRVKECEIGGADISDHNPMLVKIDLNNRKRQTVWRLNMGLLNSEQQKEQVRKDLQTYMEENDNEEVNPTILWDAMKAVMRGKLIAHSAMVKKAKSEMYKKTNEELRGLEKEYQKTNGTEVLQKIKDLKAKIKTAQLDEIERHSKYVKQNYYETGAKASKLLAKRLRKQQTLSNINKIRNPKTQELVNEPEEIERVFKQYYQDLYTQPEQAEEEEMTAYLDQLDLPNIDKEQNSRITAPISSEEINDAIGSFKSNKSPGSDGFPAEWYKMFREELVPFMVTSFNWTLKEHTMPPSWDEAIISVIPKPGRDKEVCGSYRPISILNVDYKIYTKIIARRLANIADEMLEEDQTGFLINRQTHDNVRRTLHIVDQAQRTKTSTLLVAIDAEAAYDRVSWRFLYAVLKRFGFDKEALQCVRTLYQNPSARVKVNGSLTSRFNLQRSTRQGCSLSPTLFAFFIEPLAQAVRDNGNIQGVTIDGNEHRIALFADDVLAFLQKPDVTLPVLSQILQEFGRLSGYKINIAKTQVLALNYSPSAAIREAFNFKWEQKSIKYLGINITKRLSTLYEANYDKLTLDIKKDIERWATLPLDLTSRLETIKMNFLPRVLFLFQSLPVEVTQKQFNAWDKIISRFIWAGQRPRIKFQTLQLPKDRGGMGLPNLKMYYYAAQLRYVGCWCQPDYVARWKQMEREVNGQPIQNLMGDRKAYKENKQHIDPITLFSLDIWYKIVKKYKLEEEIKVLKWIAFDSTFMPAKQDGGFKIWCYRGMTAWCVLENNGILESFTDLKGKYRLEKQDFFRYLQLRDYYNREIKGRPSMEVNGVIQIFKKIYRGKKLRFISAIYTALISDGFSTNYIKKKWETELEVEITEAEWLQMWRTHQTTTNSRIWREFSWKNLIRFFYITKNLK